MEVFDEETTPNTTLNDTQNSTRNTTLNDWQNTTRNTTLNDTQNTTLNISADEEEANNSMMVEVEKSAKSVNEQLHLLDESKTKEDQPLSTSALAQLGYYFEKLEGIIKRKLLSVPDLICVIFLLSIYPLSVIRCATHFPNPYNLLASICAVLPISLVVTEVKYALFLLLEIPIDITKPTPYNQRLVQFLRKVIWMIRDYKGWALIVNTSYHLLVYAVVQGFSCYWFFYRSLTFKGLTHEEHIKLMRINFEDNFGDFINFNTSCSDYWRYIEFTFLIN